MVFEWEKFVELVGMGGQKKTLSAGNRVLNYFNLQGVKDLLRI